MRDTDWEQDFCLLLEGLQQTEKFSLDSHWILSTYILEVVIDTCLMIRYDNDILGANMMYHDS